jgi:hypothetical protein
MAEGKSVNYFLCHVQTNENGNFPRPCLRIGSKLRQMTAHLKPLLYFPDND